MSPITRSLLTLYRALTRSDRSAIQTLSLSPHPAVQGSARRAADEVSGAQERYTPTPPKGTLWGQD